MRYLLAFLMVACGSSAAQAEWLEAQSTNFVVYADDSEKDLRAFSEQLELYHSAMELVTGQDLPDPSPSNRVTVYVVSSEREVRRLFGDGGRYVGGFYVPRASGSFAIVPKVQVRKGDLAFSMITLLHEYAHHFTIANSAFPMPRWMGEGAAEFFASAQFPREGGIALGRPAQHRAGELFWAKDVKARQLLDPDSSSEGTNKGFDSFYGKSWLLYHYLVFDEARRGQLRRYLVEMARGKSSIEAGEEVFGDLDQLEKELDRYLRQRTMLSMVFEPEQLAMGEITIRPLGAGESEMMPVRIRSKRGVTREQAVELLTDAREVAAAFPQDPAVLAALAEAEFDAGNDAEAIAAADAAIAGDPAQVNAYVQKGYALFRQAEDAEDRDAAYQEAIQPFLALNKLEPDHPIPLAFYFRSFVERGVKPPEMAVLGLERAAALAPFDIGLRLDAARQQLYDGRLDIARATLVPLAYNPHGGALAETCRIVMERLEAGETDVQPLIALLHAPPSAEEEGVDEDV